MRTCGLCLKDVDDLRMHLLVKHNMTQKEYTRRMRKLAGMDSETGRESGSKPRKVKR